MEIKDLPEYVKNDLIPTSLAFLMKNIGFEEPCYVYLYTGDTATNQDRICYISPDNSINWNEESLCVSIPTWGVAFDWFEKNYNTFHSIHHGYEDGYVTYVGIVSTMNNRIEWSCNHYESRLKVKEDCLKALIQIAQKINSIR